MSLVKRSLTITNHNSHPIAFKVKTTAPKLYCVRPNSGRVEPGESLDVSVMLQALKEEPPSNAKCKDKFLIQSTLITAEKETMNLADIWNITDTSEEGKVHQQKLRVTFLPAEGQTLEEEEEPHLHVSLRLVNYCVPTHLLELVSLPLPPNQKKKVYEPTRQQPIANGHAQRIPDFNEPPPPQDVHRPLTPPGDFSVAREDSHDYVPEVPIVHVTSASDPLPASPAPPAASQLAAVESDELEYAPEPEPVPIPAPVPVIAEPIPAPVQSAPAPLPIPTPSQDPYNEELAARYEEAQQEIQRLRSILANMEVPEIRRRKPAQSDDGMSVADTVAETDIQTAFGDDSQFHQQEGVPLQVVVIIALGVFITTYLFF
ncbi:hypothetical protein DXG01_007039 [Tephrocybe rancida]|nr:hypothetical protein DXG01_007039 [Tephrocybe rancida]